MRITDVSKIRGPLNELNDQLFGDNGEERLAELNLWLKRVVAGLLKFVTEVKTAAVKKFVVADVLGKTGVNRDGVKIGFLGENFQAQIGSLIEENTDAAELTGSRLERYATALDIASAIPEEKRVTTPSQMYQMVKAQANGQTGPLRVDGWANLFLMFGKDGNFWLVDAGLSSDGWRFNADPLDGPLRWRDGRRVFSRK